jgi:hypothetical protein
MGTAVCIGAGWFITAKHVVEPVDKVNATTGDELMFVVLETDTALPSAHNDVYGGMLQVRGYDMHADTDLATLTAELPASGAHEIRTLDLSLRMPSVGEPVAASGYPVMRVDGNLPDAGPAAVGWERTLRASVGVVTEQNPDRGRLVPAGSRVRHRRADISRDVGRPGPRRDQRRYRVRL